MLFWSAIFFFIAITAATFGLMGIAGAAAGVAKVVFYVFLFLFAVSFVAGLSARRKRPRPTE